MEQKSVKIAAEKSELKQFFDFMKKGGKLKQGQPIIVACDNREDLLIEEPFKLYLMTQIPSPCVVGAVDAATMQKQHLNLGTSFLRWLCTMQLLGTRFSGGGTACWRYCRHCCLCFADILCATRNRVCIVAFRQNYFSIRDGRDG